MGRSYTINNDSGFLLFLKKVDYTIKLRDLLKPVYAKLVDSDCRHFSHPAFRYAYTENVGETVIATRGGQFQNRAPDTLRGASIANDTPRRGAPLWSLGRFASRFASMVANGSPRLNFVVSRRRREWPESAQPGRRGASGRRTDIPFFADLDLMSNSKLGATTRRATRLPQRARWSEGPSSNRPIEDPPRPPSSSSVAQRSRMLAGARSSKTAAATRRYVAAQRTARTRRSEWRLADLCPPSRHLATSRTREHRYRT
jgi:hypothetical protein